MFAITAANPAYAGGGGVRGQMRGCVITRADITVTNWRSQVLTRSQTLTSFAQSSWFHTCVCSVVFFFFFLGNSQLQMRLSRVMKQTTVQFSGVRCDVG